MEFVKTVVGVAIHGKGTSPVFSESITLVELQDEGAGVFVKISQTGSSNGVSLELDELNMVYNTAIEMLKDGDI